MIIEIRCPSAEISRRLRAALARAGFDFRTSIARTESLRINLNDKNDCGTREGHYGIGTRGVVASLQANNVADSRLLVDGNEVSFNSDGSISVGCQNVPADVVQEIATRARNARGN